MNFLQTDDQTIADLRLFASRDQKGIYDIYNNTATRGGELLLERMFRTPLSDLDEIQKRTEILKAFAAIQARFPFETTMLDIVEKYLSQPADRGGEQKATMGEKEVQNGVSNVITLLHEVNNYLKNGAVNNVDGLQNERSEIAKIFNDSVWTPVFKEKPNAKLSYSAVTAFDLLFRVKEIKTLQKILNFIYLLDVYISVASVATKRNFVFPQPKPKGSAFIRMQDVYHPELKNAVPNSMEMNKDRSVIFLTGANMAGKSTFLRSFSTALYIAHMGFPVAAKSLEFSVMDGIYTTINLPDNLGIGASHFYAEVLRVKQVAAELGAGKSLFVLFDELFRGTNVKDAHEGTVAVTRAFAAKKTSLFIISSHIVEAGSELAESKNIAFHYLPTKMKGTTPEYTYTLCEGITNDRHGMIIIQNEGILETLKNGKKQ